MKKIICSAGLTFLLASIFVFWQPVFAHGGATGVVKERMDLMENLKDAMKALKPIFRGKTDYDVEVVKKNALVIRDNAGDQMSKLFPAGSLKKPSEAKLEIWEDWEEFERLADNLKRLGQALHDGAGNQRGPGSRTGAAWPMGGPGMMGGSGMGAGVMGDAPHGGPSSRGHMRGLDYMTDEQLAAMPAQGLFNMVANNCTHCHKQFRIKKK